MASVKINNLRYWLQHRTFQSNCPIQSFWSKGITSHIAPFRTFSRKKVASSATFRIRWITCTNRNPTRNTCYEDRGETERVADVAVPSWVAPTFTSIIEMPLPSRQSRHVYSRCTHALVSRSRRTRHDHDAVEHAPIFYNYMQYKNWTSKMVI